VEYSALTSSDSYKLPPCSNVITDDALANSSSRTCQRVVPPFDPESNKTVPLNHGHANLLSVCVCHDPFFLCRCSKLVQTV